MGENVSSRFYTLLILEIREKVSRNRINNKKCLEMGENVFFYFWTLLPAAIQTGRYKAMLSHLKKFPSELSPEGAKRGVRDLQIPHWSPPDDPF